MYGIISLGKIKLNDVWYDFTTGSRIGNSSITRGEIYPKGVSKQFVENGIPYDEMVLLYRGEDSYSDGVYKIKVTDLYDTDYGKIDAKTIKFRKLKSLSYDTVYKSSNSAIQFILYSDNSCKISLDGNKYIEGSFQQEYYNVILKVSETVTYVFTREEEVLVYNGKESQNDFNIDDEAKFEASIIGN